MPMKIKLSHSRNNFDINHLKNLSYKYLILLILNILIKYIKERFKNRDKSICTVNSSYHQLYIVFDYSWQNSCGAQNLSLTFYTQSFLIITHTFLLIPSFSPVVNIYRRMNIFLMGETFIQTREKLIILILYFFIWTFQNN